MAKAVTFRRGTFRWGSPIWKRRGLRLSMAMAIAAGALRSGILESALAATIRRAVCCIGLLCPCYVYGRNAEILGSGSFVGSCLAHCILWGGSTALCCLVTDGILLGLSGCVVGGYAYRYRRALRSKYNLPEEPCGDFTTHACCHLCAICQEYREIRDRSGHSISSDNAIPEEISAPPMQTMQSPSEE